MRPTLASEQQSELASAEPLLSVIVPAYNEEALLAGTVESILATLETLRTPLLLVIVNDGSQDATGAIADRIAEANPHVLVSHQDNQGMGAALKTGLARSRGRYAMLWPADMPCSVEVFKPFLEAAGRADVIVGCRLERAGYSPLMRSNAWLYPIIVRALFSLRLRDVNWICMYDLNMIRKIQITQNGFPMLAEILIRIRDLGGTFHEIDTVMQPRASGAPSASRFRVMWRTLTGLLAFWWGWRREHRGVRSER